MLLAAGSTGNTESLVRGVLPVSLGSVGWLVYLVVSASITPEVAIAARGEQYT